MENLHFFTDRAADATLNPFALPFTASMQDYILVLAESIARQCVLDPKQRPITHDRLLRWAYTSFSRGNEILAVEMAGSGDAKKVKPGMTMSENSKELEEIQTILLEQMCLAGKRLGVALEQIDSRGYVSLVWLAIALTVVWLAARMAPRVKSRHLL